MYVCTECNGLARVTDTMGVDEIVECVDCGHKERRGPTTKWAIAETESADEIGRGVSARDGHPLDSTLDDDA